MSIPIVFIFGLLCLGTLLMLLVVTVVVCLQNRQEEQVNQPPIAERYTPPSGLPVGEEPSQAVGKLLARGRKIEAIKLYRELTGAGLKEAKEAVERMEKESP
ncbi:MAG: ribosomal protein L7/L12 [Anaerolineales bacterium]|nr:ribosomal protein L7/L12 [Anaerolineales bacterium]